MAGDVYDGALPVRGWAGLLLLPGAVAYPASNSDPRRLQSALAKDVASELRSARRKYGCDFDGVTCVSSTSSGGNSDRMSCALPRRRRRVQHIVSLRFWSRVLSAKFPGKSAMRGASTVAIAYHLCDAERMMSPSQAG